MRSHDREQSSCDEQMKRIKKLTVEKQHHRPCRVEKRSARISHEDTSLLPSHSDEMLVCSISPASDLTSAPTSTTLSALVPASNFRVA